MQRSFLLFLSLAASVTYAFNINSTPQEPPATASAAAQCTRRVVMERTTATLGFIVLGGIDPANADVIRSPGKCANGEGEGCDSLAEDNELIRSLQKKSSENREANQRVGSIVKGDFGLVGWAAVAVILNDLTSSFFEKR